MPLEIIGKTERDGVAALSVRLVTWDGGRNVSEVVSVPVDQGERHRGHQNCIGYYTQTGVRGDIHHSFGGFSALASRVRTK